MKCSRRHACKFVEDEREEDDERICTREHCEKCGRERVGIYAKSEEWGPVGYWQYADAT